MIIKKMDSKQKEIAALLAEIKKGPRPKAESR